MAESWVGVIASGESAVVVEATVDGNKPIRIESDATWKLQTGPRPKAYALMHKRFLDYVSDRKVDLVVFKESALPMRGMKKAHLLSAELRGVLLAAASEATSVVVISKASVSRTFGERSVDEYVADGSFWEKILGKALRIGSRGAGVLLLAVQAKKFG